MMPRRCGLELAALVADPLRREIAPLNRVSGAGAFDETNSSCRSISKNSAVLEFVGRYNHGLS